VNDYLVRNVTVVDYKMFECIRRYSFGTRIFTLHYPQYFAAIALIAGAYKFRSKVIPDNLYDLEELPIRTFHGGKDEAVQACQTEILVDTLKAYGSNIRYALYSEADHPQSWIQACADPELYTWLFAQTLKQPDAINITQ
jgi:predicted peptidase